MKESEHLLPVRLYASVTIVDLPTLKTLPPFIIHLTQYRPTYSYTYPLTHRPISAYLPANLPCTYLWVYIPTYSRIFLCFFLFFFTNFGPFEKIAAACFRGPGILIKRSTIVDLSVSTPRGSEVQRLVK